MEEERYPGERRGLTLFLGDLLPVVESQLGGDCLLAHCARRALRRAALRDLRHARQMFNAMPRDTRSMLTRALVAETGPVPARHDLLETYSRREPTPFVCFESQQEPSYARRDDARHDDTRHARPQHPRPATVAIRHELLESSTVLVLVRPNTLPSAAVKALREIADMIEGDRRLLSTRFWDRDEPAGRENAELG